MKYLSVLSHSGMTEQWVHSGQKQNHSCDKHHWHKKQKAEASNQNIEKSLFSRHGGLFYKKVCITEANIWKS